MTQLPSFISSKLSSDFALTWTSLKYPQATDLIGAWTLSIFGIEFEDQRPVFFPFGQQASGLLIYSSCRHMSAILSHQDCPPFSIIDLEKSHQATVSDKAKAFDHYLSYGGTWEINHHDQNPPSPSFEISHYLQWSLTPHLKGTVNKRRGTLWTSNHDPSSLILHLYYHRIARSGIRRTYHLLWQKKKRTV